MGDLRVFRNNKWSEQQNPDSVKILHIKINDCGIPVVSLEHQMNSGYLKERTNRLRDQ